MRWLLTALVAGLLGWLAPSLQAATVARIRVAGAIGPATATYIARALGEAAAQQAQCLIVELDTPGGLLDSTKEIVQSFYSAQVPVVVYVAPAGANAGSAGCFITLAADVAAMAPNTSIGAAHPVAIGGLSGEKLDDVMKQKLENFATSYIESIAAKRKRNVEWAKSAVRESASITAEKALELKVIEVIAKDLADLQQQLDGRELNGRALRTAGAAVVNLPMSLREKVFQALARPEVMFIFMLIAVYGIIGELSNPGAILPGVAGAIALIVALYLAAILPINVAGVALIVVACGLFVADVFATMHGVLTAGGVIAFVLGSLMLFDRSEPAFRLSLGLILPAAVVTAVFFTLVIGAGLRAQFWPVKAGRETMLGKTVKALTPIDQQAGKVWVEGEYWNAVSEAPIEAGRLVEIAAIEGLTLKVKAKSSQDRVAG
jgi:membrane-bound serine protease (ClpP class)